MRISFAWQGAHKALIASGVRCAIVCLVLVASLMPALAASQSTAPASSSPRESVATEQEKKKPYEDKSFSECYDILRNKLSVQGDVLFKETIKGECCLSTDTTTRRYTLPAVLSSDFSVSYTIDKNYTEHKTHADPENKCCGFFFLTTDRYVHYEWSKRVEDYHYTVTIPFDRIYNVSWLEEATGVDETYQLILRVADNRKGIKCKGRWHKVSMNKFDDQSEPETKTEDKDDEYNDSNIGWYIKGSDREAKNLCALLERMVALARPPEE